MTPGISGMSALAGPRARTSGCVPPGRLWKHETDDNDRNKEQRERRGSDSPVNLVRNEHDDINVFLLRPRSTGDKQYATSYFMHALEYQLRRWRGDTPDRPALAVETDTSETRPHKNMQCAHTRPLKIQRGGKEGIGTHEVVVDLSRRISDFF